MMKTLVCWSGLILKGKEMIESGEEREKYTDEKDVDKNYWVRQEKVNIEDLICNNLGKNFAM